MHVHRSGQSGPSRPAVTPDDGYGRDLGRMRGGGSWIRWLPWAGLVAALAVTAVTVYLVSMTARSADTARYVNAVDTARDRVSLRLNTYAALLRSAGSFLTVDDDLPSREAFARYVEGLDLPENYPGIRGLGLAVRLSPTGSTEAHRTRLDALRGMRSWPPSQRESADIVTDFEPPMAHREAGIGFDMSTDPVRAEAMERAARSGELALSGKVLRQHEFFGNGQAGFNLYQPIYEGTRDFDGAGDRQERLIGFIYVPFRASELFEGLFGTEAQPEVDVEVFDGEATEGGNLLFRSSEVRPGHAPLFTSTEQLKIFGRTWTVRFTSRPGFDHSTLGRLVPGMAGVGLLVSLLVFHLLRRQTRAYQLAEDHSRTLRLIVDSGVAAIAVADTRSGEILEANDAFQELAGDSVAELRRGRLSDLLPGVEAPGGAPATTREAPLGRLEADFHRRDGTSIPVLVGRALLPGAPEREVVVAVDLRERKQFEIALQRSEERYKLSTQATRDLIWDLDLTTSQVVAAGGGAAHFGQPEGVELPATELIERIHPDDVKQVRARFFGGIRDPDSQRLEASFRFLLDTGSWAWVEARGFVVRDAAGRPVRLVGSLSDVSERYRVEEERAALLREAQEGVRIRDEFLSVASHELKTPLTPLSLRLQKLGMLADQELDGDRAVRIRHHVEEGRRQVVKLTELIATLLDVGRIDSGRMRTHPDPVELSGLVREAVDHRREEARRAGSQLELELVGPIRGSWDPRRIEQIVDNLVANAIKYGEGHPIQIRLEKGEPGWVTLSVTDTGIGIDEGSQERIFERFARAVSERHYGGLGLGLYVTRALVEVQGGTIRVESVPGEGSTFIVELPYEGPDACGLRQGVSPSAP